MSGFVYVWRDRKHNRYYVGSHWGLENDGYVCSSRWMRNAYSRRPQDFKRRVIARVYTTRLELLKEEGRWLQMIKPEELKGVRYYNMNKTTEPGHWSTNERSRLTVGQKIASAPGRSEKIGAAHRGRPKTDSQKRKISNTLRSQMTENRRAELAEKCSGWSHSEQSKTKIAESLIGRPVSEETRNKLRLSNVGKSRSEETKNKMREASSGSNNAGFGKKWITDGARNVRIYPSDAVPNGWRFGKTYSRSINTPSTLKETS